ncbi:class I SAM-dependent methyltransferase [Nitratireductor soli]|uniref:class I SAM-dependent methyltransferase n=1 Tax=Nitratireductor soli TaxID=1670619 RepID=UPI00065E487A|nr:class I SAM-dependent methyltransferase [Nitratireductor soli]
MAENCLEGWCSRAKAVALTNAIIEEQPQLCVEIGIFGGRSIVPCAAALRQNGSGVIYGIETWSPAIATEHFTSEENDSWWQQVDFPRIKQDFFAFIALHGFTEQIRVIEKTSRDAASLFDAIDFLHIDGAHSVFNAAEDVVLYASKLKIGGIVVLDDIDWPTTGPAHEILKSIAEPLTTINDDEGKPACAFMRKVRN